MKIYTGSCHGSLEKIEQIKKYNLGILISREANKLYKDIPCAIDNGAFECYRRGLPFSETRFMQLLEDVWKCNITADFIVCPDIVCAGQESLRFSMSWVERLRPAKLALVVQDGLTPDDLNSYIISKFSYIFVGGSLEWKWQTAETWVNFAHSKKLKCHIGRCGTLEKLEYAKSINADSVDSTSFVRNNSWHILDQFYNPLTLFKDVI